jgi:hypothetical protein
MFMDVDLDLAVRYFTIDWWLLTEGLRVRSDGVQSLA